MDDTLLPYLAGFFDGEGCVSVSKNGSLSVRVIGCHKPTLELFLGRFHGSLAKRVAKVNKTQYYWGCYGDTAQDFLLAILPFLSEKKQQAQVALDYYIKRNSIPPVRKKGAQGTFANPKRSELVEDTRAHLTRLKKESFE